MESIPAYVVKEPPTSDAVYQHVLRSLAAKEVMPVVLRGMYEVPTPQDVDVDVTVYGLDVASEPRRIVGVAPGVASLVIELAADDEPATAFVVMADGVGSL